MLGRINNTRKIIRSKSAQVGNFNNFRFSIGEKKAYDFKYLHATSHCTCESINNQILALALSQGFDYLTPHLELVSLSAGKELHAQGENSNFVYFPETAVERSKLSWDALARFYSRILSLARISTD